MAAGYYTVGGKINTTTVNGATYTGLYAANGSINVVLDDAVNKGIYHPCGAIRVNTTPNSNYYDGTGAARNNHLFGPGR